MTLQPAPQHGPAAAPGRKRISAKNWVYIILSTIQRFNRNKGTDMAATLTYYSVLAVFPALLSLVSLLKLSGIGDLVIPRLTDTITEISTDKELNTTVVGIVQDFFSRSGAGIGLAIGVLTAAWAASGYVAAFTRAMNRIYGIIEGRNPIKLKILQFAVTFALLVLMAAVLLAIVVSGDIADWIATQSQHLEGAVQVWQWLRWPLIIVLVMVMIGILYHVCPNVRFAHFRPLSYGAVVAALTGLIAVAGFSFYASNFGRYDATYGALAGAIIALWLVWLTNLALILGVHLDLEVLRTRQLLRGLAAEREPLLELKDTTRVAKRTRQLNKNAAKGNQLRLGSQ